ncbi:hypothetical protein BB560_001202 [Smittium megazygosporum]|uniref:Uncharacterized protein n=1 Tax=Smittium megazygosporum TaxID=133381 RepID=A0A2T9ZI65_9FUNG|nr:hypothetical protein BB560_001202 [Smittium megazygosporum]
MSLSTSKDHVHALLQWIEAESNLEDISLELIADAHILSFLVVKVNQEWFESTFTNLKSQFPDSSQPQLLLLAISLYFESFFERKIALADLPSDSYFFSGNDSLPGSLILDDTQSFKLGALVLAVCMLAIDTCYSKSNIFNDESSSVYSSAIDYLNANSRLYPLSTNLKNSTVSSKLIQKNAPSVPLQSSQVLSQLVDIVVGNIDYKKPKNKKSVEPTSPSPSSSILSIHSINSEQSEQPEQSERSDSSLLLENQAAQNMDASFIHQDTLLLSKKGTPNHVISPKTTTPFINNIPLVSSFLNNNNIPSFLKSPFPPQSLFPSTQTPLNSSSSDHNQQNNDISDRASDHPLNINFGDNTRNIQTGQGNEEVEEFDFDNASRASSFELVPSSTLQDYSFSQNTPFSLALGSFRSMNDSFFFFLFLANTMCFVITGLVSVFSSDSKSNGLSSLRGAPSFPAIFDLFATCSVLMIVTFLLGYIWLFLVQKDPRATIWLTVIFVPTVCTFSCVVLIYQMLFNQSKNKDPTSIAGFWLRKLTLSSVYFYGIECIGRTTNDNEIWNICFCVVCIHYVWANGVCTKVDCSFCEK